MASPPTPEPPAPSNAYAARQALTDMLEIVARPDRGRWPWLIRAGLVVFVCACLPLLATVVSSALVPDAPPLDLTVEEAAHLAEGEVSAEKQAALDKVADEERTYRLYRNQLALIGALALLVPFLVTALAAQVQLVQRHWYDFVGGRGHGTDTAPLEGAIYAAVAMIAVTFGVTFALRLPYELAQSVDVWSLVMGALVAGLTLTLAFVTIMGAYIVGGNYPQVLGAERLEKAFRAAREACGVTSSIAVLEIALPPKTGDEAAQETPADADILIDRGLTPEHCVDIINSLCLVLAVAFVLAVAVLSFVGGAAVNSADIPTQARDYVRAAVDGWVLLVGLGASLTLALAYVPPMLRLLPFLSAAEDLKPEKTPDPEEPGWTAKGTLGLKGVDVTMERTPEVTPEPKYDVFSEHRSAIGVSREKFRIILKAAAYGGAFHTLTETTLTKHLKSLFAIIAPTLAGTVLSFLG